MLYHDVLETCGMLTPVRSSQGAELILQNVSKLTEIQKAIEELAPEEKEELRDWLDERDDELEKEWAKVAEERLRGIQAGERKTIDASDVLAEARRMIER
ncbi:MAG TPA: hypothetical protein VE641_01360 [Chthoniobacterales bacterium]|nr:hypothetical protein [Chthoniobacterales bacterium]